MPSPGLGGVAATDRVVIVSGRDRNDTVDLWRCLDAANGETLWSLRYPASGKLDFGPSPRATALIHDGLAFCYGAFGHLHAVDVATGKVAWKHDSQADFAAPVGDLPWGLCGSPLIASGKLIYYPGGADAALVALDPKTGSLIWKAPGIKPGYGSFIAGKFGGVEQVIGYDATTLGGWDLATGKRIWTVTPDRPSDFNVPTPIVHEGRLIVSTENNGTRIYQFGASAIIDPKPVARNMALSPDTHSPVRVGTRLFGVHDGLHCLDLTNQLQAKWTAEDPAFHQYATAVASDTRLLVIGFDTDALLIDATAEKYSLLDRRKLVEDEEGLYAHPAFANGRMYLRTSDAVICFEME